MEEILSNIQGLFPFLFISWSLVILCTLWKPQRYFNSFLLMIALFFTLFFIAGLFGENMPYAFLFITLCVILIIFLVPILLIMDGVITIKKEGFSFAHILSILLGVGVGIGELASILMLFGWMTTSFSSTTYDVLWFVFGTIFYFSCIVLSFVLYSIFIQILPHIYNFDYVIIHGCGLINGHQITRLLANRIDAAMDVFHKCKKKPMFICSGGKGNDEDLSEAEAMKNYLLECGIDEKYILLEDKSTTTMENILNSEQMIGSKKKVALVSSNYHIYRCLDYAKKVGLKCVGIGAKTALYYYPTAIIREFVAVLRKPKFLFYTMLGYVVYMLPILIIIKYN